MEFYEGSHFVLLPVHPPRQHPPRPQTPTRLDQAIEDRTVSGTFTVTNLLDANPDADVIRFRRGLSGTIGLTTDQTRRGTCQMYLLLSLTAAIAFASGGVFMKLSEGLSRVVPTAVLFLCFAAGAGCQALALRRAELGVGYLLVLGLEAVLALVLGLLFFHESCSLPKALGVGAIVVGLVLLHLGEC